MGITAIELAEKNPPHIDQAPMRALCIIPFEPPPVLTLEPQRWSNKFKEWISICLKKNPKERASIPDLLKVNPHFFFGYIFQI